VETIFVGPASACACLATSPFVTVSNQPPVLFRPSFLTATLQSSWARTRPRECQIKWIRERWTNATLRGQRWSLDSGFPSNDRTLRTSSYTLSTSALPGPRSARFVSACSLAVRSLSNADKLAPDVWLCGRAQSHPEKFRSVLSSWAETLVSGTLIWTRTAQESGFPNRNGDPHSRLRTTVKPFLRHPQLPGFH